MSEWRCEVVLADGRRAWRRVIATDADDAAAQLIAEGITPLQLRSGAMGIAERLQQPIALGTRLSASDQALVLGQLATLLKAGMPLDRSLDLLAEQMPRARQRDWLRAALAALRAGERPSVALANQDLLPLWVVGVIAAADRSGRLDTALANLAEQIDAAARSRSALVTALTYPAAIVAATLLALIVILTLVVPQFEPILAGNVGELPLLTRIVLGLSSTVRDNGMTMLAIGSAGGGLLWLAWRSGRFDGIGRGAGDITGLLVLRDRFLAARFALLLAALLRNGIALVPALGMVGPAMGSRRWSKMIAELAQAITEGSRLTAALSRSTLIPATLTRLIEVGEHSGALVTTLTEAGRIVEAGARARLERLISLANPIAIILLGAIVALLVAGVLLGLFSVGDFAA
jgi:general secretion pathway protein F